ncbi:MAG TPA: hypothetical protein VMU33_16700 [Burkholderiaceae bacterium]|nr:hypothetical protein [Burkholderiaceae bacterium]
MTLPAGPGADLRSEIAAAAARLIADEGFDYGTARRRAAELVTGHGRVARHRMPDDADVESALREHLRLFAGDEQPRLLAALRQLALQWMERLAAFNPHLAGAALNGTATAHSDLALHLFTDSAKDVEMFLINDGVDFDVIEGDRVPGGPDETIQFVVPPPREHGLPPRVGIRLAIHAVDAIRVAPRRRSTDAQLHRVEQMGRAGIDAVRELLADAARGRRDAG